MTRLARLRQRPTSSTSTSLSGNAAVTTDTDQNLVDSETAESESSHESDGSTSKRLFSELEADRADAHQVLSAGGSPLSNDEDLRTPAANISKKSAISGSFCAGSAQ